MSLVWAEGLASVMLTPLKADVVVRCSATGFTTRSDIGPARDDKDATCVADEVQLYVLILFQRGEAGGERGGGSGSKGCVDLIFFFF